MKLMTMIGIILVVLGVVGLIYGGINYTHTKNVMDIGAMHLKVDDTDRLPIPPIAGGLALAAGAVLILMGRRRTVRA